MRAQGDTAREIVEFEGLQLIRVPAAAQQPEPEADESPESTGTP